LPPDPLHTRSCDSALKELRAKSPCARVARSLPLARCVDSCGTSSPDSLTRSLAQFGYSLRRPNCAPFARPRSRSSLGGLPAVTARGAALHKMR